MRMRNKLLLLFALLLFAIPANAQTILPLSCFISGASITCGNNTLTPTTGTVTSVSVTTANGVSGTVATATTTPAISLTLGAITPTTVNGNTITTGTGTLTLGAGKVATISNTLTLTATDGSTLAIGTGGTLGTNAYTSTAYAPIASPTFTGTVTIPTLAATTVNAFTLAGTISGGGNQINNIIIGTTTPLAGAFTIVTASASMVVGGTTATTPGVVIKGTSSNGNNVTNAAFSVLDANTPAQGIYFRLTSSAGIGGGSFADQIIINGGTEGNLYTTSGGLYLGTSGTNRLGLTDTAVTATVQIVSTATDASSVSTGALQVPGGASFNKRIWMDGLSAASGTPSAICRNANEITVNAALTCTVSSLRFKHDFVTIDKQALPVVMAMRPGSFFYNDNDRQRIGFAAEYMAELDRRLADGWDADDTPRSIDQNAILAIVVKAIQELKADNDNLRDELGIISLMAKRIAIEARK